jgi:hypothetical protein
MKPLYYILDDNKVPQLVSDNEWSKWFGKSERFLARTQVGPWTVSTVFLGIDHNFGEGEPILFETMAFRDDGLRKSGRTSGQFVKDVSFHEDIFKRYSTYAEAMLGHAAIVHRLEAMNRVVRKLEAANERK